MGKSGGIGSNFTHIKPELNDNSDLAKSTKNKNKGAFKNKHVKTCKGTNTVSASKPAYVESSNRGKKKLDQDYVISLKQLKQKNPILETSGSATPVTEMEGGEFYFVDPTSKQKVIDNFRNNQPPLTTYCIKSSKDLEKNGLLHKTWLDNGEIKTSEGRLFLDKPLTLIFDLTAMNPGEIASFNDMLQKNPSFNDKKIAPQVKIVCLVNNDMLEGRIASNPDLWRRLAQMTKKPIPTSHQVQKPKFDDVLLNQMTTKKPPAGKKIKIIDFTLTDDWHQQLFGGINFDKKGNFVFFEGALAKLQDNDHLVFKNAPWDNPAFKVAVATVYREGCFEANLKQIPFPQSITLSKQDVTKKDLEVLKSKVIKDNSAFNSKKPVVSLNAHSIRSLESHKRVEGDKVVQANSLASLLKGSDQLVITDSLNDKQWLWLLTQLEQLPQKQRPSLFKDIQPSSLIFSDSSQWRVKNDLKSSINGLQLGKYIQYDVSPSDSIDSLCQVNMSSQSQFKFSLDFTPLLENLMNGNLVVLSGLEKNPVFAANLETLLLPKPYLFMHGHKIDLPKANVILIKPTEKQTVGSTIIQQAFNQCSDKRQSSENQIYSLLKSLPRSFGKNYPTKPPWNRDNFEQQFEEQAQLECNLDGSTVLLPCHKRRALHVLLAKAYRGDPNVYGFIKSKIRQYYPDMPERNSVDKSALKNGY